MTRVSIVLDVQSDGERPCAGAETRRAGDRRTSVERRSGRDRRGSGVHSAVVAGERPYRFRSLKDRRSPQARRWAAAAVVVEDTRKGPFPDIEEAVHVAEPYGPADSREEMLIRIGEGPRGMSLHWLHVRL